MHIYSINDPEFAPYGRVIEGIAADELLEVLEEQTPLPEEGTKYMAEDEAFMALDIEADFWDRIYGGMPVQLGWCNGHNTKLNCLEYHRDSEINLGTEDFILLLGQRCEIEKDGMFDTAKVKAFRVPAGVPVEIYATTLHYAPCSAKKGQGFKVLVVLPRGTNTEKPQFVAKCREDTLMTARNKWLLAHPDSNAAKNGAVIGLKGDNIDIAGDLS